MHLKGTFLLLITCLGAALPEPILADSLVFEPSKDNTLYEDATGSVSSGAGSSIFAGRTNQNAIRRALLAFDLSAIPPGSVVNSVSLTLTLTKTIDFGTRTYSLHRLARDWGEGASNPTDEGGMGAPASAGDATWLHTFFDDQFWESAGGDFQGQASSQLEVGRETEGSSWPSTAELVQDVQHWVDNPTENHGWILIGGEEAATTARRFASREDPTPDNRPRLEVDFTPPEALLEKLYFAQFGNGDGFFSQILLFFSDSENETAARIIIKKDDGSAFPVVLNGQEFSQGTVDLTVPPSGLRVFQTDAKGPVVAGSVTVCSDRPLTGLFIFGGGFGLAGVASSPLLESGFTGPVETSAALGIETGVAIQNLGEQGITIDLELLDTEGQIVATSQVSLPTMGHTAQFVTQIPWDPAVDFSDFRGTVRATAPGLTAATMIQVRQPAQFATLPVTPR